MIGAGVFGGLALAISFLSVPIAPTIGGTLALATLALYAPPIAVGVCEWKTLKPVSA